MKKALCLIIALTICLAAASCSLKSPLEVQNASVNGGLIAHFIDVGQGDSILLESGGEFVLIDAGEPDCGQKVVNYINSRGADTLKYVIATHPHSDHSGGIGTVLNAIAAENFITSDTDCDTPVWTKLLKTVDSLGINYIDAGVGDTYSFGSSSFTIMGPVSNEYEDLNEYSVVVRATCGDISYLLTGDAERINEYEMLDNGEDVGADLLKCGHHGSSSSTSTRFLQAVNPAFAVVTCAKDNEFGHPHKDTLQRLGLLGCPCYSTADHGTVIASTDGKTLTVSSADGSIDNASYTAGEPKNRDSELLFVGDKSSMYFHDPICSGVKSVDPDNRAEFASREDAANDGYTPCPDCTP